MKDIIASSKVKEILKSMFDTCAIIAAVYTAVWAFIPKDDVYSYARKAVLIGLGATLLYIILYAYVITTFYILSRNRFALMRSLFALIVNYFAAFTVTLSITKIFVIYGIGFDLIRFSTFVPLTTSLIYHFFISDEIKITRKVKKPFKNMKKANRRQIDLNTTFENILQRKSSWSQRYLASVGLILIKIRIAKNKAIIKHMEERIRQLNSLIINNADIEAYFNAHDGTFPDDEPFWDKSSQKVSSSKKQNGSAS